MNKRLSFILILIILIQLNSFSQKEANIWYFGQYAGIDFNTGSAVALTNSAMSQYEGCASISDRYGNLLFYTNGMTVWNRNHNIMQNGTGLMGGESSTQSGIIVPKPSDSLIYYIFTVPDEMSNIGLRYSVVDLNQAGGLGAITTEKNIYLAGPTMEKLTGVRHSNGNDVWVITHLWNSSSFYSYLITESGVNHVPVISNTGTFQGAPCEDVHGSMKVSPDGKKLAIVNRCIFSFELFDFDNALGIVANPVIFPSIYNAVYGIEFSPDVSKLYIGKYYSGSKIFQFNLNAGDPQSIINSAIQIGQVSNSHLGALQLATDGKIYVSKHDNLVGDNYLGVINDPNEDGLNCNFVEDGFNLGGKKCIWGLPNFLQNFFATDFTFNTTCFLDTTFFSIVNTNNIVSVLWDFGDPNSGSLNYSTQYNPYHVFSAPGPFSVSLTIHYPVNQITLINEVIIDPLPVIDLGNDTIICSGSGIVLEPGAGFSNYLWNDGSTLPYLNVVQSGIYWVEIGNEYGCSSRDSINVTLTQGPNISLGNDSTLCEGDTLKLSTGNEFLQYLWQDGSTDSVYYAIAGGTYWLEVSDNSGCFASDTIILTFIPSPYVNFGPDTLICFNQTLLLSGGTGGQNYLWQDGSTAQTFLVSQPGTYWVQVSNDCGNRYDTISIEFTQPFDISLGNDTTFCYGQNIVLDAGSGFSEYLWSTGATSQLIIVSQTGTYWVQVTDEFGCIAVDSMLIDVFDSFDISIGNDSVTICKGDYIFLNGPDGYQSYLWQDGSNGITILAEFPGIYWLEVSNEEGCIARDSMFLNVNEIPADLLGNDTIICPASEIILKAPQGYETYLWQDGSTNNQFVTNESGKFWVTVQDEMGCSGTDSVNIKSFSIPNLGLNEQEQICSGDSIMLIVENDCLSFLWQDGTTDSEFWAKNKGYYWVRMNTECGYFYDSVEIQYFSGQVDLGNDTILNYGDELLLSPEGFYSDYTWNTGSHSSSIRVSEPGIYWLEAFDGDCMVSDTILVEVCAEITVPNIFTPNSDGYNDLFYATSNNPSGILGFKMVIFNRWGRIVHTLENLEEKWNGEINGSDCSEGVYFWICDFSAFDKFDNIKFHSRQGSVTLMR